MNEPFDNFKNQNPLKIIFSASIIVFISLSLGIVIPALIDNYDGVFYKSTMIYKLPKDASQKIAEYNKEVEKVEVQIQRIDDSLLNQRNTRDPLNLSSLLAARSYYEKRLQNDHPQIQIMPLYLNPIMLVWVIMYISLGWLIYLFSPFIKNVFNLLEFKKIAITTLGIYVIYEWTVWMRNFVLSNENRVVYSFANYDVSPSGFFVQEVNTIIFAVLLSIVWSRWLSYYNYSKSHLVKPIDNNYQQVVLDDSQLEQLSRTFIHWQICSIILGLGFIDFTSAFWDLIIRRHDQRYLLAGVTIHCLWGVTWMIISLPLFIRWYDWNLVKSKAIHELINTTNDRNVELKVKAISDLNPFGFWNIATSGVVAFISFILPIIQAFFK